MLLFFLSTMSLIATRIRCTAVLIGAVRNTPGMQDGSSHGTLCSHVLSFLVTLFFTRVKKRVTRSSVGGVEALALRVTRSSVGGVEALALRVTRSSVGGVEALALVAK